MVECRRCGLLGAEVVCGVCRAELTGRSLLTWDTHALARFLVVVLYRGGGWDSEREAA